MTRKFNKPPCYPWVYDTPSGKATVVAAHPDGVGWVGFITYEDGSEIGAVWNDNGIHSEHGDGDLRDVPKRMYGFVTPSHLGCTTRHDVARQWRSSGQFVLRYEYDAHTGDNPTITKVE